MEIKKIKRMKKYKDIGIYDFSDYAEEITGDALFEINGDQTYLMQMSNIMKNSGYEDTEAVKWIEN